MKVKRIVAIVLILCLFVTEGYADTKKSFWGSVGDWVSGAVDDSKEWVSGAVDDSKEWVSGAWDDSKEWAAGAWDDSKEWAAGAWDDSKEWAAGAWDDSKKWVSRAWDDSKEWVTQAWKDSSAWLSVAWDDSSKWVSQAWADSSEWASTAWKDSTSWTAEKWDKFSVWVESITAGNPYEWINDTILIKGVLAYDRFSAVRTLIEEKPNSTKMRSGYRERLSDLSILNEDKDIIWNLLQEWSAEHKVSITLTAELALPFLERLLIEGSTVIGENVVFSGPVIAQYLITTLEAMRIDSTEKAESTLKKLTDTLNGITRPVIIGDVEQNILVTDDGYYIEYFTYANKKYQVILVASKKDKASKSPLMRGQSLDKLTSTYFKHLDSWTNDSRKEIDKLPAQSITFTSSIAGVPVTGKAIAVWAAERDFLYFIVTKDEWKDTEAEAWINSIHMGVDYEITFDVDMESDGAFYGINQQAQKYTIKRSFDDEYKFTVPKTGHGWAAERGNNLIDNIKGFFKGSHSTVVGDNNVKNGADRKIVESGKTLYIQTKYYENAAQGIAVCFDNGKYRYLDSDGMPMAVEVPSDSYEVSVQYMKNRIQNGEVPGIDPSDTEKAYEIVRKGNLTYQQAKHIAKAGTVESILYDSVNACVSAASSMGISAAVDFAVNMWSGEGFSESIKQSIYQGLSSGGTSFIISVLSSQLAKSGLNTAMVPASKVIAHALGPKVSAAIVNAFRPAGSAIYGAAAMQSAAKLLRGNVITGVVSFVVLSTVDVANIIQGKISWKQLAKNASTTAVGIVGGTFGYLGGAALGTAILPGAGTVVGLVISAAAGWGASKGADAIADLIADDDAEEMIAIIEEQFTEIATEYFMNEDEVNEAIENLQNMLTANLLMEMYQYKNHEIFARQIIEMSIDPVVAKREHIDLPSDDEYSEYVIQVLEDIYSDLEGEDAAD